MKELSTAVDQLFSLDGLLRLGENLGDFGDIFERFLVSLLFH